MVLFHEHPSSVAHVENEFIRHIACPNCGSSDANAIYTDGHTFCHKCHYRTHGDGTPTIHNHTMSDVELKGSATRLAARKISEKTSELFKTYKDGQILRHYYYDVDGKLLGAKVRTKDKDFAVKVRSKLCSVCRTFATRPQANKKSL